MRRLLSRAVVAALAVLLLAAAPRIALAPEMLAQADQLVERALTESRAGNFFDAVILARRALEIRQTLRGAGAGEMKIAEALNVLGRVHYNNQDFPEAENWFRQALTLSERASGASTFETSIMLGDLGAALRNQSKFREAEALVQRSLQIRRAVLPADSPPIAGNLQNLGLIHLATGRYASAVANLAEAARIHERASGEEGARDVRTGLAAAERANAARFGTLVGLSALLVFMFGYFVVAGLAFYRTLPVAVQSATALLFKTSWVLLFLGLTLFSLLVVWPMAGWAFSFSIPDGIFRVVHVLTAAAGIFAVSGFLSLLGIALGRPAPAKTARVLWSRDTA